MASLWGSIITQAKGQMRQLECLNHEFTHTHTHNPLYWKPLVLPQCGHIIRNTHLILSQSDNFTRNTVTHLLFYISFIFLPLYSLKGQISAVCPKLSTDEGLRQSTLTFCELSYNSVTNSVFGGAVFHRHLICFPRKSSCVCFLWFSTQDRDSGVSAAVSDPSWNS